MDSFICWFICWVLCIDATTMTRRLSNPVNGAPLMIGAKQTDALMVRTLVKPDIILFTDASSKIGVGGISNHGHWFQNKWTEIEDVSIQQDKDKDNAWKELAAVFTIINSLGVLLHNKLVQIYSDHQGLVYMHKKMKSRTERPDLQILIDEICKSTMDFKYHLWLDHIPGKDNKISDALSRYKDDPFKSADINYDKRLDSFPSLQLAHDLCNNKRKQKINTLITPKNA